MAYLDMREMRLVWQLLPFRANMLHYLPLIRRPVFSLCVVDGSLDRYPC